MSTNFPTNLDTYTNPNPTDQVSEEVGGRTHAEFHTDNNDAIEALEAKVGVNGSAVTTSHDYKLSGVTGSDKAASLTGSETLTNKIITAPTISSPTITGTAVWNANVNFNDEQFSVSDNADTTKQVDFELSGATAATKTTIAVSQSANRTVTLPNATDTLVGKATSDVFTNKTFDANATGNSISNLETADFAANVVDNDPTLNANSSTRIPTQQAVKAYGDAIAAIGNKYVGVGIIGQKTFFNIQIPFTENTSGTSLWVKGGTTVDYYTFMTFGSGGDAYTAGFVSGGDGGFGMPSLASGASGLRQWTTQKQTIVEFAAYIIGGIAVATYAGFITTGNGTAPTQGSATVESVGFIKTAADAYYIRAANGSGVTETAISTPSTGWHQFRIEYDPAATQARFYIDGVSAGTITTNLPTAVTNDIGIGFYNSSTNSTIRAVTAPVLSLQT